MERERDAYPPVSSSTGGPTVGSLSTTTASCLSEEEDSVNESIQ